MIDPDKFVISRRRKLYRFALFANSPLCFEHDEWDKSWQPDIVEIGAGTGLFAVGLAEQLPDKKIVAIDVKADRLQKGARLAAEKSLTNIRFLRTRADLLAEVVSPQSLETIWVTFPDPFPRTRSAKRRLTHPTFLDLYARALKPRGNLCFKTDAIELYIWSLEQLVHERWRVTELSFDLYSSDLADEYKIPTTYEQRFIAEGLTIHFVRAKPSRTK